MSLLKKGRLKLPQVIHKNLGDALQAEKVAVRAGTIRVEKVAQGSSRHRIKPLTLEGNVFCVIEIPLVASRSGQTH